jgi:hypothetical protein
MLFIGEITPCNTWYLPLYSCARSIASTPFGSGTTHTILESRLTSRHTIQSSPSVKFKQIAQNSTLFFAVVIASAKDIASSSESEIIKNANL